MRIREAAALLQQQQQQQGVAWVSAGMSGDQAEADFWLLNPDGEAEEADPSVAVSGLCCV